MTTPYLSLPEMIGGDPNKFIVHNQTFRYFESLSGANIEGILDTPPVAPVDGELYLVGTAPTGDFVGQSNNFAYYDSGWLFIPPVVGTTLYNVSDKRQLYYTGSQWDLLYDLPFVLGNTATVVGELNKTYGLNSTVTTFTVPQGVNDGDRLIIIDYDGNFSTGNVTLNTTGGDTILDNVQTSLVLNRDYTSLQFLFSNGIWRLISSELGLSGGGGGGGSNITIYVSNITGSDANDGLTVGTPVKTLPAAQAILDNLDISVFNVTILINEDYTYTDSDITYWGKYQGATGVCRIQGANALPSLIRFIGNVGYTTQGLDSQQPALLNFINNSYWEIENLRFDSNLSVQHAYIHVKENSVLQGFGSLRFITGATGGVKCISCFDNSHFIHTDGAADMAIQGSFPKQFFSVIEAQNHSTFQVKMTTFSLLPGGAQRHTFAGGFGGCMFKIENSGALLDVAAYVGSTGGDGFRYIIDGSACLHTPSLDTPGASGDSLSPQSVLI